MDTSHFSFPRSRLLPSILGMVLSLVCVSCFTGVEGTKKITLSREDKKALLPSEEEIFFGGIKGTPLSEWQSGKDFIAADNKTILLFEQMGLPPDPDDAKLGGSLLSFAGTEQRIAPDGKMNVAILFNGNGHTYSYNTGKGEHEALMLTSDQIPMMIDCRMVDQTKSLLVGKKLWIKSPLWYDADGNRIPGMKFIPVVITDAQPASAAFPVKLKFSYGENREAWVFMNFGMTGNESRPFHTLFSLSDIRKRFPSVSDEAWEQICLGRVKTGMTKEECKLAIGNPDEVNAGHDYSQTLDLWNYSNGTVLWFEDGILTRYRR